MISEALAQGLQQHLAIFGLRPALLGAFTNLNPRLNNCYDLTGKLNFGESWNLIAIFEISSVKFIYFVMNHRHSTLIE